MERTTKITQPYPVIGSLEWEEWCHSQLEAIRNLASENVKHWAELERIIIDEQDRS